MSRATQRLVLAVKTLSRLPSYPLGSHTAQSKLRQSSLPKPVIKRACFGKKILRQLERDVRRPLKRVWYCTHMLTYKQRWKLEVFRGNGMASVMMPKVEV